MQKYLILSFRRSGSVLLAHNIGRNAGSLPVYVKESNDLSDPVIHSHLLFTVAQTQDYMRIFSLRRDPVQTILSCIIANHTHQYHQFQDQPRAQVEPFEYHAWDQLDRFCEGFITWHHYYSSGLAEQDSVVIYEDMIDRLTTTVYDPIYPNKIQLLMNYQQVVDRINLYQTRMLDSCRAFLTHQGHSDAYQLINYLQ